jgi:hypothetical protein
VSANAAHQPGSVILLSSMTRIALLDAEINEDLSRSKDE